MAVKEILAGVDIEGRSSLGVQRTESNELEAMTCRPGGPILVPQVIEQRQALFDFFQVFAHGAVWPPETSVGEGHQRSQARMVGARNFLRGAGARGLAESESPQTKAQRSDQPDLWVPANERCGRAFRAEKNEQVGKGLGRGPSGGV